MADLPQRKWLRHEVPETVSGLDPVFFLTVCCQERKHNQLATDSIWTELLKTIIHRNESGLWNCTLFLVMPDHVHGIFSFSGKKPMKDVIADWKRWTATQLKINWQKGFFDHRLRDEPNAIAKRRYILNNPVRAGLVEHFSDWPYYHDSLPNLDR